MAEHTPGPWHWINPRTDAAWSSDQFEASLRTVQQWPTTSVGDLPKFILTAEMEGENLEADARLIAAAPDMLEALHIIANQGGDITEPWAAEVARAAIAKAEGR